VTTAASTSNGAVNANNVASTTTLQLSGTPAGQAEGQQPPKSQSVFPLFASPIITISAFLAAGVGVAALVVGRTLMVSNVRSRDRRPRRS
jgi:hypothetical protein